MDIVKVLDRYCAGDEFKRPVESAIEQITALRQRVAELEKERDDWQDEALGSRISIETLTTERDALKKLYESSEEYVLALKETRNRLAEERDKAAQYWQIAEGRCDALINQRDELVKALSIAEPVINAHAGPSRLADFRFVIASVKGKA